MTMTMSMGDKFLPLVGKITHLIDPSDFWLQSGTEADLKNFKEFEQQICNVARSLPVADVNKLEEGIVVLVCCSTSGSCRAMQWRRAKVLRIDREGNTFDVLYTDYGKTEIVPAKQVRWNVPDQIQNHACDCYRCALAGIQPIARSWTTRGIKKFKELVNQKTFKVAPLIFDHATLKLRVSLYPLDEPSRSVTHEMLDAETGLTTDECVKEYLKDVTPCSFGEVYGVRIEDYNLYGEEEPGPNTSKGIVSEDVEDGGQSWATCSDIYSDQTWATCSESSTTFPQDKSDDARESVYRNFFSETGMSPETEVQMGMHQGVGQETASSGQLESGLEERTRTSADSTAVVVPGFNLSGLQQRRMPSAQELQREQDEMQKAMRRARLQKDMIECHRDLDNLKMEAEHGQKWGNSDLLFLYAGQRPQNSRSSQNHGAAVFGPGMKEDGKGFDDGGHSGIEFDLSPEISMMSLYPEDKGLKQHQDYVPETVPSLASELLAEGMGDVSDHEENGKGLPSSALPATSKSLEKDAVLNQGNQEGRDLLQERQETVPDEDISQWFLPQPPELHPSWTVEDKEYRIHSYIAAVLKTASRMDEVVTDSVCAAIYCLADVDAEHCEAEIKMVLEALLEEAVKFEYVRDLALTVFHSYSSVLREELLLHILKDGSIKFIKPATGKMQAYCSGFVDVLIRLLSQEHDWPVLLKTVIQDFTLTCLEKWIIFNKKGAQTGLPHRQLEDMYMDCAERLLPVSVSKMQESNYEQITFIFDQMREKVLEADVDYSVRSRLLTLLLKFPTPDSTTVAGVESHIKKSVHDQAVQVDKPPLHGPPSPPTVFESTAEHFCAVTMEKGCQTEGFEKEHNRKQSCDMSVQTEALELGLRLHRSSVCSNDSTVCHADNLESTVSVPGRARRRRQALLEHFSKQKQGGEELHRNFSQADYANSSSTASPDCDPVFTSAAQLYSQQPVKGAASDPDGVRVESGAEAGLETIADASSVQSTENSVVEKSEKAEITCQTVEPNLHVGEERKKEEGQLLSQHVLVGKAEKESSEKSQKVSFMSAMSLVSRAAISAVFGNGKDHSDYSETTHSAAVSSDLERGEQRYVAGLQSDILPNKEKASSVYTLKDGKVGETHIASGTEKFLDRMGVQGGEVSADKESYNDAFKKCFRDASRVSSLSETRSSSMSTGQQSPSAVNYASPVLSSRSVAEDEDGDLSDWDDDFDFSRYAYGGDQSVDNTGVEDAGLSGDRTKGYRVEDFGFSGNRTKDYGVEDFGFSGNRTKGYCVEDFGFSGNRTKDCGVEDAGFSGGGHGGKKMFSPEDFPPLPAQPVYRGSDIPEKSQLTLGAIANDLLEESPEKSAEENRVPDSHTKVKGSKFSAAPNRSGERVAPGFGQSEAYLGGDGDGGSVPSEWEDHVFPSSSVSSDCHVSGSHDASKAGGGDGFAGHYSQGKWLNEESAACRQHKMDPAGDSFTSQLSLASGKISSFPQESRSSTSTPPMVSSPGSSVPYQRGDLTSMFDGSHPAKSKGRKKKFHAFDALQPVVPRAPESSGNLLDLDCVVCTNCDEVGHLRSDCQKPLNSIFL